VIWEIILPRQTSPNTTNECQDLFAFGALKLCPGGDFLPDSDDFVASLLGEGA
jgi:hypothetical protein